MKCNKCKGAKALFTVHIAGSVKITPLQIYTTNVEFYLCESCRNEIVDLMKGVKK